MGLLIKNIKAVENMMETGKYLDISKNHIDNGSSAE